MVEIRVLSEVQDPFQEQEALSKIRANVKSELLREPQDHFRVPLMPDIQEQVL